MVKTDYSHLFSNLKDLEMEYTTDQGEQSQHKKNPEQYKRHQLGFLLKKIMPKDSIHYIKAQLIVEKYFTCYLNPAYEKISNLPKKFFVCGYCKQPFFRSSEYLKHCLIEKCPVNHQRSTFLIKNKQKSKLMENEDFESVLIKDQLQKILRIPYSQENLILSRYEIKESLNKKFLKCENCSFTISYRKKINYLNHCVLSCPYIGKVSQRSQIKIIKNEQNLEDFKAQIINFHINLNLLNLFSKSVLTLKNSENFYIQQIETDSTQNNTFQNIFYDIKKNVHKNFKLIGLPFYKSNYQLFHGILTQKINRIQNQKKQMTYEKFITKINKRYDSLSQYLQGNYFCGICLKFYSSIQQYLAHCFIYLCHLNYEKSSHKFYEQNGKKQLNAQNIPIATLQQDIQKMLRDKRFEKIPSICLYRKSRIQKSHQRYKCGQCLQSYAGTLEQKNKFIHHVLKICQSYNHQLTNHEFKICFPNLTHEEYVGLIINHFYGMKIAESSFGSKFVLSKNDKIRFQGNYFCDSCETSFQSQAEFVYHSISVCQSLESQNSSHFIRKIYNPSATVEDPVLGLIQQLEENSQKFQNHEQNLQKSVQKQVFRFEKMQIEQESNVINQSSQQIIFEKQNFLKSDFQQEDQISEKSQQQELQQQVFQQTKKLELQQQQDKSSLQILEENETKFLRYNVNFIPLPQNKSIFFFSIGYYCGKCDISFKKQSKFIEHLQQQTCRSYQNLLSSHFYITNKQMNRILSTKVFKKNGLIKLSPGKFPQEYSVYQPFKSEKITCECKQQVKINKFSIHNLLKHGCQNLSKNYVDIRFHSYCPVKIPSIILSAQNCDKINYEHEFICPCKPWKKLTFGSFVKHILKRHEGKTPKFYMMMPQQQK